MKDIGRFTEFLETIDLDTYRNRYSSIKIVEMDLPKEIQALKLLYKFYWEDEEFLSFDDFYSRYSTEYRELLEDFREKIHMCENCFYLGLPARIYRTWASIITQIHGGYVAEQVFGEGTIEMSEELDHQGADFRINYEGNIINIQVKKITQSREVRRQKTTKTSIPGDFYNIEYFVPTKDIIRNPYKQNGELRGPYLTFKEKYLDNNYLKVLDNGFVIFQEGLFQDIKHEYDI